MTFWRLYYHIVWSTKGREPLISPEIEARLFAYLVKKASELEVFVYAINGWNDHIHVIVSIPPKVSVAELVKHLKGASSHYTNHDIRPGGNFAWQRGYGALSIGEKQRPIAEDYVRKQKVHHQENTVNAWLERCTDDEEIGQPQLREEQAPYDILGEFPF